MRTHHSSVVTRPARQTCKHQASGINPSQSLILALCTDAGSKGSRRWLLSAARQKPPGPERAESFELRPLDSVPDFEAIGSLDLEIAASLLQIACQWVFSSFRRHVGSPWSKSEMIDRLSLASMSAVFVGSSGALAFRLACREGQIVVD